MPAVDANGVRIWVEDEGDGEPLVLIMGIAAQLTLWPLAFVDGLVARGFRVIRIDNRDVGLSQHLDGAGVPDLGRMLWGRWRRAAVPGLAYDLHDMARDVVGVLDALGVDGAHLAGSSMGGMIAQICAIEHPERVRSLTSMMSSPGDPLSSVGNPRVLLTLMRQQPTTPEEAGASRWTVTQAFNPGGLPLDERATREAGASDFRRAHNPPGAARQFAAILATPDRRATLPSVRCPTHVVHGTHDPMIPARAGRRTARLIPGATLSLLDRMGHTLHPSYVEQVADEIRTVADRAKG